MVSPAHFFQATVEVAMMHIFEDVKLKRNTVNVSNASPFT